MKEDILGYAVDTYDLSGCVDTIMVRLEERERSCRWLSCLNPHSYAVALSDTDFMRALKSADWLVPDGVGVVHASKMLKGTIKARVTGSDVFNELHARMNTRNGMRVFFLGASEDTLAVICSRMAVDYPNIRVAGTYSPPFRPAYSDTELNDMFNAINQARPDVLWVGMTAPKQEKWIYQNLHRLDVKFAAAVGAVFDFYAGKVKRSHPAFQRLGLEWLPRLMQQPRRLWKRMFVSAPIFVWHVVKQAISQRNSV